MGTILCPAGGPGGSGKYMAWSQNRARPAVAKQAPQTCIAPRKQKQTKVQNLLRSPAGLTPPRVPGEVVYQTGAGATIGSVCGLDVATEI